MTKTLLAFASVALSACASQRAATAPDGSPYTLEVFFDRNSTLKNPEQVDQVVSFMEPDLHQILSDTGYAVVQSSDPETFVPGPTRFLLVIKVVNYYPGSTAARILVGFGAGSVVLDTQHLLYSGPGQILLQATGTVGSARGWNYAARKINVQIKHQVNQALSTR